MSVERRCIVIRPPKTDACGAPADRHVIFLDGSRATACGECALYLQQVAINNYATTIGAEKIA